jgi:hypothetical protein
MEPVVAASQALDRIRYVAPAEVLRAADNLFDCIILYFRAASSGADEAHLVAIARQMHDAKLELMRVVGKDPINPSV